MGRRRAKSKHPHRTCGRFENEPGLDSTQYFSNDDSADHAPWSGRIELGPGNFQHKCPTLDDYDNQGFGHTEREFHTVGLDGLSDDEWLDELLANQA